MLGLKSPTTARWLTQVEENLEEVLIDHAHCEKKAARTAMNLLCAYDTHADLCREMTQIVAEELGLPFENIKTVPLLSEEKAQFNHFIFHNILTFF